MPGLRGWTGNERLLHLPRSSAGSDPRLLLRHGLLAVVFVLEPGEAVFQSWFGFGASAEGWMLHDDQKGLGVTRSWRKNLSEYFLDQEPRECELRFLPFMMGFVWECSVVKQSVEYCNF
jgi:hypothetical protein